MKNIATTKKKIEKPPKIEIKYHCLRCGLEKRDNEYYSSKFSKVWNYTNKRVLICKDCVQALMEEITDKYGERIALITCCAYLDLPFIASLYQGMIADNSIFNIGVYIRQLQMVQHQRKAFITCLTNGDLVKSEKELKEEVETKWSKKDKQNMNFAISTVGYDPFNDCNMTDIDRKYCFNILAGYCDIDGVREDGHKIQSVVQMTQLQLQIRKLDELINQELLSTNPDEEKIKKISDTKKSLQSSMSTIVKDNNLSSAYNNSSKAGKNALSAKMKQIFEDGYDAIRVNMFDIEVADAMKQVADLSNRSLFDQLSLDANEYTDMIKEMREVITNLHNEKNELEEEKRNLKNQIIDLEKPKSRK